MVTATAALAALHALGCRVEARDGDLHLDAPKGTLTADRLATLRRIKPALLELVSRESATYPNTAALRDLSAERVPAMPLSDFAAAGLRVVIDSELLGEQVTFLSDNATLPERDGGGARTPYRAVELRELVGLDRAELVLVHRWKAAFQGTISADSDA